MVPFVQIPDFRHRRAGSASVHGCRGHAEYPEEPITLIVPYAGGGSSDIVARLLQPRLEAALKQTIVIENVTGGAGSIGAQRVVIAEPEGYTLLIGAGSEMLILKQLNPDIPYDVLNHFKAIAMLGLGPMVLTGKPSLAVDSFDEVIELAKSGQVHYGTGSIGTFMNLVGEAINFYEKVQIKHTPYRGSAPAMTDSIGDHLDLGVTSLAGALAYVKSGQAKVYAVTSEKRTELAPETPPCRAGGHGGLPSRALDRPIRTGEDAGRARGEAGRRPGTDHGRSGVQDEKGGAGTLRARNEQRDADQVPCRREREVKEDHRDIEHSKAVIAAAEGGAFSPDACRPGRPCGHSGLRTETRAGLSKKC